jgi:hypothetical protein
MILRPLSSYFYNDSTAPRPNRPRPVTVVALIERDEPLLFDRRAMRRIGR